MTILTVFEGHEIRFVGTADKPEWVASDVVAVLYPEVEPKNRSTYLRGIPVKWKGLQKVQTLGGEQEMVTVFEAGLYHLIIRSNSPKAEPFQEWVFEDVLKSIRKTGGYRLPSSEYNYYDGNLADVRTKRPWREKNEISESQLKVYCFLRDLDRWTTANEVAEGTGLHPSTVRSFLVYFRKGGLLDMLESYPRHLHKFSEKAEARNPSLVLRLENAIRILGNPLIK